MSNVIPFDFKGAPVRVVTDETGELWFVGADVCGNLGYSNQNDAMNRHCRGVVKRYPIQDSLGRLQETRVLSEPDTLRLIVNSKLPAAVEFERWVFEDVLPSVRRTGGYHVAANGEFTQGAIREFQSSRAEILEGIVKVNASMMALGSAYGLQGNQLLLYTNKAVEKQTGVAPMALLGITGLVNQEQELHYTATELGKKHSMSANSMNKLLAQVGLQRRFEYAKGKHRWELTPEGRKHGVILDTAKRHSDGTPVQQIRWRESVLQVLQGLARQLQATLPAVARG